MYSALNSNNGLSSKAWGPAYWHVLYCWAGNAKVDPTDEDRADYVEFIKTFWKSLPCRICRDNFIANVRTSGLDLCDKRAVMSVFKDRDSIFAFVYRLHTVVSKHVKGQNYEMSFSLRDARSFVESLRAQCTETGCTVSSVRPSCQLKFSKVEENNPTFESTL